MNPGDIWYDYSDARPSVAQLKAAGVKGVSRYLSPLNADGSYYGPTAKKMITQAEFDMLVSGGVDVVLNYEWYEGRLAEGEGAGSQDAYWAATLAYRINYRDTAPIIFSDDKGDTPYANVVAFLLAARAKLQSMPGKYNAGYYGRAAIIAQLAADPRINWPIVFWQTSAWSGNTYGGVAQIYQDLAGGHGSAKIGGCDVDVVCKPFPTHKNSGAPDMAQVDQDNINAHTDAKIAALDVKLTNLLTSLGTQAANLERLQWRAFKAIGGDGSTFVVAPGATPFHIDTPTFNVWHDLGLVGDIEPINSIQLNRVTGGTAQGTVEGDVAALATQVAALPGLGAITDAVTAGAPALTSAVSAAVVAALPAPVDPEVVKTAVESALAELNLAVTREANAGRRKAAGNREP